MKKNQWINILGLSTIIIAGAMTRIFPHPWNFTAIGAMALLGGSQFKNSKFAFAIPLVALFISDLVIGGHPTWIYTYSAFLLVGLIGRFFITEARAGQIFGASLASAVVFFLVTNFGVWATGGLYPMTFQGLVQSYVAGIPFFGGQVFGDLFYSAIAFGSLKLLGRLQPEIFTKSSI